MRGEVLGIERRRRWCDVTARFGPPVDWCFDPLRHVDSDVAKDVF